MGDVIPLGNITYQDIPTEDVLEAAKEACTDSVLVLGYDEDGYMYFASSKSSGGDILWLLEKAKMALMGVE